VAAAVLLHVAVVHRESGVHVVLTLAVGQHTRNALITSSGLALCP
jgi:hypothetical protein